MKLNNMKLISMTDFVENLRDEMTEKAPLNFNETKKYFDKVFNYSEFLKQPLKLEMFVPCDENGNILEKQCESFKNECRDCACREYKKAIEKVLFEGFELIEISKNLRIIKNQKQDCQVFANQVNNIYYKCSGFEKIEDLVKYVHIKLTETAIKQLGL